MKFSFSHKTALITGGSRGIGRSTALLFAESGANIALNYNSNHEKATKTFNELVGGPHLLVQADISDPDSIEHMVNKTIKELKGIHILVNNAGVFHEDSIVDMTYTEWQGRWKHTINTNLIGPANVSFCVLKHMVKNGGGKIINVSSRGAFRGEPDAPDYGASKAGLNSLSQSLAKALAPYNILVYTVAPGYVHTDMVAHLLTDKQANKITSQSPLGRVAKPEEIASCIAYLASDEAEYLTGSVIDINGASYLRT